MSQASAAEATVQTVLHHTDKSIVAAGERRGRQVVIKLLISSDPYWLLRRRHEIDVYRQFQDHPPPVRVPRLVYQDNDGLTVLSQLPGVRVHHARHVDSDLSPATVAATLDAVNAVSKWTPTALVAPVITDYPGRVDAEHAAGLFDNHARSAIYDLLEQCADRREFQHGDPLPANLLSHDEGCGLVDWEHAGPYLPGWDLAILDTVAGAASPTLRTAIEATVAARGIWDPYRVNLALVVAREIRIHQSLPTTDPLRTIRLATLEAAQHRVHTFLHIDTPR